MWQHFFVLILHVHGLASTFYHSKQNLKTKHTLLDKRKEVFDFISFLKIYFSILYHKSVRASHPSSLVSPILYV